MDRIPLYLGAMLIALASMTTNIYNVHKWNLGIVKLEPWRQKLSTGVGAVKGALRSLLAYLWTDHRQLVTATALLIALLVLQPQHAHAGAAIAVMGSLAQLQTDYDAAREHALSCYERQLDPATTHAAMAKAMALKDRLNAAKGDANFHAEIERMTGRMTGAGRGGNSIGKQIMASEMGQWLLKNKGRFPSGTWQSPSSEIMAATLTEDAASGGDLVITDYQRGILSLPTRRLVVADLIAPGTTESNSVGYMKETTATNAAATVAEGAAKPESTLVFDAVSDPVRKIATWLPVTEELLEDVPAIQGYIDTRLRHFVQLTEDDQLLNGDGTAPNISGILDRAGITTALARTTETNPDVILKQISIVEQATSMEVDGIVMHPTNWDTILLLKTTDGEYIASGGPFALPGRKFLWGRPVAVTPAITLNSALVGAFKTASQFFRRGGLRVEASNSHSDFFIKNLVAIRAEERGALCVYRESAFGKVTNLN